MTMVKDDSLVWHHPTTICVLDPLWPPNPMLGFGFSSRVHLGVVYRNFSLAQTHLSTTMLIEDNYAKRTW